MWIASCHVARGWQELETFLNDGAPPIYMGFGLVPLKNAAVRRVGLPYVTERWSAQH
jgi:hypothetical protein